ncbi:MAG: C/D box methylation guide ribonucleoprotein complex aNOP56 subunit, partial [Desulfurococcaceae archaeon]
MKGYVIGSFMGFLLCNDKGEVVEKALFPSNPQVQAERLYMLSRGEAIEEVKLLCEKAYNLGLDELVVEDPTLAKVFVGAGFQNVKVESPNNVGKVLRAQMFRLVVGLGYSENEEEAFRRLQQMAYHLSAKRVVEAVEKRDLLVAQAVSCIDEVEKMLNILASRLREWYGIHFPELGNALKDHEAFLKAVMAVGHRSTIKRQDAASHLSFIKDRLPQLARDVDSSLGADVLPKDVEMMKKVASATLELYRLNDELRKYVEEVMGEVAPNIKELVGPVLGARLICLAGGLERLAKMPASTVQLLGAEKALFRSLKTGSKPPKHGVIFQHPEVHKSPRWQRGKIARALAGKIAIAARVDYFTGEYVADELKEELESRVKEVKEIYKEPPRKVKEK